MKWEDDFQAYLHKLDEKKPVIVCGDMNVAHQEIDLKNPKTNHKNAGFTDEEREKMTQLLSNGFIDTFRTLYPKQVTYLGGRIVSVQERRIRGGVSTISSSQNVSKTASKMLRFIQRLWEATTVLWKLS